LSFDMYLYDKEGNKVTAFTEDDPRLKELEEVNLQHLVALEEKKQEMEAIVSSKTQVVESNLLEVENKATLVPLYTPKKKRVLQNVTTFQQGHGFALQSASGSQTDSSEFAIGSQSLKLATAGNSAVVFNRNTALGTFDLTGKQIQVTVKVKNLARLKELTLYLFSGGTANFYSGKLVTAPANRPYLNEDEWATLTYNLGDLKATGTPSPTNITGVQLRVVDDGTGPVETYWNGISLIEKPSNGVISVTMDDGWLSQYTEARRIMDKYGFAGTAYIIADVIGVDPARYMTLEQLKKLRDVNGWDISAHAGTLAVHNKRFDMVSSEELIQDMAIMRNWLVSNGFQDGAGHIAYPGGGYNSSVLEIMKRFFSSGRSISEETHETFPPADQHRLRIVNVLNTMTIEEFKAQVDKCYSNNTWLILCYHQFTTPAEFSTQVTPASFDAQMAYIASKGVPVRTVGDVIRFGI
jgi:peptidoglycan/xylan/chitin deacetylase (PgdA/CDA1 family)